MHIYIYTHTYTGQASSTLAPFASRLGCEDCHGSSAGAGDVESNNKNNNNINNNNNNINNNNIKNNNTA